MSLNKKKLYLISNMYPSNTNVRFGIFVKRFEEVIKNDFKIKKFVVTKHYSLLSKVLGYLKIYIKVISLYLRCSKNDIIYIHYPLYFSVVIVPLVIMKRKVVINFHGGDVIFDSPLRKFLSVFLLPIVKYTAIVVPSEYYAKVVRKVFKLSENKEILVYPSGGVDKKLFYPIENSNNGFVVGFVSNFIRDKGWKDFLDAMALLKNNNDITNIEITMVGDGPDRAKILDQIKRQQLNIKVLPTVKQDQLAEIYNKFTVLIFPTYKESLGLVGIEAMMCGIPVIASKVGGPMGYVKDGYNGFLFETKNSIALKNAILKFSNLENSIKNNMKINAKITAAKYESKKTAGELISFLNRL